MAEASLPIGHIGEYDPQTENITSYLERLSLYMDANSVAAERKVPVLLTVIGAKAYGILKSLTSPDLPKDKSLDELQKALKAHFDPQPKVIAERFRFYQRSQTEMNQWLISLLTCAALLFGVTSVIFSHRH